MTHPARIAVSGLVAAAVVAIVGCTAGGRAPVAERETTVPVSEVATPPAAEGGIRVHTPAYRPNGRERAEIVTSKGRIVVELYGKEAPIHVGNFVELAEKGFYDGLKFHRYVPGFVIQGGDPATRDATPEEVAAADGDPSSPFGYGGPGYVIRGEFDPATNPHRHVEGALAMARSDSPDSAGSQFYFALADLPQLDGNYTVFGAVIEGMDVVRSLRAGDTIEAVRIIGASR